MYGALPLRVVDGCRLDEPARSALAPAATLTDRTGTARRLPRWFLEIDSWDQALNVSLAPDFRVWEMITTDVREAAALRGFLRYVPCAITLLAAHLHVLRDAVGTYVHIAANGGYRSAGHELSTHASRHCWGTAANIYRIGNDWLDNRARIEHYAAVVRTALPHVWLRPYGHAAGEADDHLHIDLGYVAVEPAPPSVAQQPAVPAPAQQQEEQQTGG
jgi:hypothetical protein